MRSAACGTRDEEGIRLLPKAILFLAVILVSFLFRDASAGVKVIEADYLYALGDNDNKVDARRIATQEAQRKALELAGTHLASITQVKEYRLTKDQITAYTAGIVETQVIADEARGSAERPEHYIRARCSIDTDVLVQQIGRYWENEDLREQLEKAAQEREALRKERDAIQKQLAAEQDKAKAEETRKKLDTVLSFEEGLDDTYRAWIRLSPRIDFFGGKESSQEIPASELEAAKTDLLRALGRDPGNARAHILLASVHHQQQDPAAAEEHLRLALQRVPNSPLVHLRLGIVLREQGKYAEALKEYRIIEHKRPNHPQMLFQTGLTHQAAGNCRLAVGYMKRLLLYTKKNDRPDIAKLKPGAKAVIEDCGDQPAPKKQRKRRL